ncbi:endonuclease/exonuclease/phosphatase family protein [Stenotrophomonas sp. SY1]|uniref:endonuclease/exonuclease/phosphatase family protein n=1 Tax=Stenotrophomonas sp. SY1 TaxID=477235 RepID=UPI001E28854E|nr:endonuclease/exonuclease/phosphatase family protein [Stenotrophomonas sp. SY1]MCD9086868.1 endonuclease/exonuclease/phosphatase family protein [Stenotrophomonas sp. SY1]
MLRLGCFGLLVLSFSVLAEPATPVIKIASLRLPTAAEAWTDNRERIVELMQGLQADVIVVQDVHQSGDTANPACWLGGRLKYSCDFISSDRPSQPERHGSAVLSRLTALEDAITLLHGDQTPAAAGMQRLQLNQAQLNLYVARMRPGENSTVARGHQAADLRSWMDATSDGLPTLIVGDFAATTDELVRQLPGFQPMRRNPSAYRRDARAGKADNEHGMDVLYQVRSFADISRRPIELTTGSEADAPLVLGMLATLRVTRVVSEQPAAAP